MKYSERETREQYPYLLDVHYPQDVKYAYEGLPPPQRGAYLSTASKYVKQQMMRRWLVIIASKEDLDMTPTLAGHFVEAWMERKVSNRELYKWFGIEGRTAADKSPDAINPEQTAVLIAKYLPEVQADLAESVREMTKIRERFKKDLKAREKAEGRKISTW